MAEDVSEEQCWVMEALRDCLMRKWMSEMQIPGLKEAENIEFGGSDGC
jgi:hypothetical protein